MLKRTLLTISLLLLIGSGANGQETPPNLVGVWHPVDGMLITYQGDVLPMGGDPSWEVEIISQEGPVFSGTYRWSHPESVELHDGESVTNMAEEAFLGVFSGDDVSFVMADTPDVAYWFGQVLAEDRIELRYIESGPHAAAGVSVLERR